MIRTTGLVLALGSLLVFGQSADAQTPVSHPGLARELLEGCLGRPTREGVERLAAHVGATPYSDLRRRRELKASTSLFKEPDTDQDQRTKATVTEFEGWDLSGPGAGSLAYKAERTEIDWLDRATQQPMTAVRVATSQSCVVEAPVADARAIFELYEGLTDRAYGVRISADRRWLDVFMFDENRYDIELSFILDAPLKGLAPDTDAQEGRLILLDGNARLMGGAAAGIPIVKLTRAAFLEGLAQPATVRFFNEEIKPMVQRLTAVGNR